MKKLAFEKIKIIISLFLTFVLCFLSASATFADAVTSQSKVKKVIVYDGSKKKIIETKGSNFGKILKDLEKPLGTYDKYWTSTESVENGSLLYVERAVPVTVVENGKFKVIYTTQQTVQGVLNDAGYDWRSVMSTEDALTKVTRNMVIHVVPYTVRTVERVENAPCEYERWYDSSLGADETVIVKEGTPGKRQVEVEEFLSDGKVIRSGIIKEETIEEGTKGIIRTGNKEGTVGWVTTMNATAYHPSDGNGLGITATGTRAGYGTVAVDPSVIPLGTRVYIPQYGDAIAADTGGAIKGNKIDLCMETFEECYNFGRQDVEVFIAY